MQQLFSEFSPANYQQWQQQVLKDLKGEPFETLLWRNENGFTIEPFYTAEQLKHKAHPTFAHRNWDVCEYIAVTNEAEANATALRALAAGASGLCFTIHQKINTQRLLQNISVEHVYTQFNISNDALHLLNDVKDYDGIANLYDGLQKCFVTLDPLHLLAKYGEWHHSAEYDLQTQLSRPYLNVNGILYFEAGAYAATQLGISLAHLNEYLHYLTSQNEKIPSLIHLSLAIGNSFFTELAKLKAVRHLVQLLLQQYDARATLHIHAQTGWFNKSAKEANTNLLRTSTESMSAVLGGCNSLCTLPFNHGFEVDTDFSRRIARNQQLILKGESYFDQLADVSAGSYYIETLTEALGEKAWACFKAIEAEGGYIKSFTEGKLQARINADCYAQQQAFATQSKIMVGVNKFQTTPEPERPPLKSSASTSTPYSPIVQQFLAH